MKKTVIGIIAHVDSGKTTLSEAMLYLSGEIRKIGRVDHGDAFLDTDMIEKNRGITVFSKPAEFEYKNTSFTLLDTPGHVDFSAETERALQVLDLAVLVISGTDGVQSHTQTLWRLLNRYNVPTFVFVNKMDLDGADKTFVMNSLEGRLGSGFVDFCRMKSEVAEDCALFDENIMNEFLESGSMSDKILSDAVAHRKVFPCFFGSALKSQGIEKFMNAIAELAPCVYDSGTFGAKVYKISEDGGSRLTFMKITGGCLKVRDLVDYTSADGESFSEKVSRIRIYSGAKYRNADNAETGVVCAVEGLTKTYAGQGFGFVQDSAKPLLEPVLTYRVEPVCDLDMHTLLSYFRVLENEDPQLHVDWNEQLGEIHVSIMGEVQLDILKSIFKRRFDIDIDFGEGSIAYKETIEKTVYGYGHYEPLRHYAEVHLKLEPLERGKGLRFATECSEDTLDKNWQRLILTHLQEKKYILLSAHREENIDTEKNFLSLFTAINRLAEKYDMPILYSCHPRSRKRLEATGFKLDPRVRMHEPMGFHDYNCLQMNAYAVVSDSGTLPEESSFFTSVGHPFPAVCIRTSTERPEALDKGIFVLAGIDGKSLLQAVDTAVEMNRNEDDGLPVPNYTDENVSAKVVKLIQSYTGVVNKMVWRK